MYLKQSNPPTMRQASVRGLQLIFPRAAEFEQFSDHLIDHLPPTLRGDSSVRSRMIKNGIMEVASGKCRVEIPDEHIESFTNTANAVGQLYESAGVLPNAVPFGVVYNDSPFYTYKGHFSSAIRLLELSSDIDRSHKGDSRIPTIAHELGHAAAPHISSIVQNSILSCCRHGGAYGKNGSMLFRSLEELTAICVARAVCKSQLSDGVPITQDIFLRILLTTIPTSLQKYFKLQTLTPRMRLKKAWKDGTLFQEICALRNATHTIHSVRVTEHSFNPPTSMGNDPAYSYLGIKMLLPVLENILGFTWPTKEERLAVAIIKMVHGSSPRAFLSLMKDLYGSDAIAFLAYVRPERLDHFILFFKPEVFGISSREEVALLRQAIVQAVKKDFNRHSSSCSP